MNMYKRTFVTQRQQHQRYSSAGRISGLDHRPQGTLGLLQPCLGGKGCQLFDQMISLHVCSTSTF